ncbi:hypothetical protein Hanom_Chr13g01200871 [Helianthus anomalus]
MNCQVWHERATNGTAVPIAPILEALPVQPSVPTVSRAALPCYPRHAVRANLMTQQLVHLADSGSKKLVSSDNTCRTTVPN